MLETLKRRFIVAELILKLPENSEISRNFREGKIKINQIYMKFSISNLLFWFLTVFFWPVQGLFLGISIQINIKGNIL